MAHILVVEDHPGIRETYEMLFIKEGHKVVTASDGRAALDATEEGNFDIILLDMLMPEMSGLEFLRAYEPSKHPDTKVVVFSNLENPEVAKEAMLLGVERYVRKATMPPREMADMVKEVLAG